MISADDAQKIIFEHSKPAGREEVPLVDALQRFVASAVTAPIDLPPFDNAAMDGFAVRSGDTVGATPQKPVSLKIIGRLAAGDDPGMRYASPLQSGETVSIMTGAPIPPGADAVVPYEETLSPCSGCRIDHPVVPDHHIRRRGEDLKRGEPVCGIGETITFRTIALLSALGLKKIGVFKRPTVRVLVTGSELTEAGLPLAPGRIYNSNGPALAAALQEIGIRPESVVSAPDSEAELSAALKASLDADVLITIGGVSAGDFDLVPEELKEQGARILFHRVAIKPGKPFLFAILERSEGSGLASPERGGAGAIGGAAKNTIDAGSNLQRRTGPLLIFALPGNPVSALMVFDRFVRPALLKKMEARNFLRPRRVAIAAGELTGSKGREDYLRGIVEYRDGRYTARSAGGQGSAHLLALSRSNAILIIPESRQAVRAGEPVEFQLFSEAL